LRAEHHSRRDTVTMLNNVARSLVSLVRGSGIRKDYNVDDSHGVPPNLDVHRREARELPPCFGPLHAGRT